MRVDRGLKWLLDSKGKESNWLWRGNFRTTDTHVRFDPDKFAWPWLPYLFFDHRFEADIQHTSGLTGAWMR